VKADGILRVTQAFQERLKLALVSSAVPGTVFVGPLDVAASSGATLVLFLYRIIPNASLRNREHRVSANGDPSVEVFQNALPLDLHFLVTLGTAPDPNKDTLLQALGSVIQALQTDPELTGSGVGHETVRVSLEPLSTDEASRIWALFPTANYRTSVAYLATPVWIDPLKPAIVGAPVVEEQVYSDSGALETVS